jgi:hypothetical protein
MIGGNGRASTIYFPDGQHCSAVVLSLHDSSRALAGASWTLAASELCVAARRAIPNSARGRICALMMVLSQGAMTVGAIVWGLSAHLAGTRVILLMAAFLFLLIAGLLIPLFWSFQKVPEIVRPD